MSIVSMATETPSAQGLAPREGAKEDTDVEMVERYDVKSDNSNSEPEIDHEIERRYMILWRAVAPKNADTT